RLPSKRPEISASSISASPLNRPVSAISMRLLPEIEASTRPSTTSTSHAVISPRTQMSRPTVRRFASLLLPGRGVGVAAARRAGAVGVVGVKGRGGSTRSAAPLPSAAGAIPGFRRTKGSVVSCSSRIPSGALTSATVVSSARFDCLNIREELHSCEKTFAQGGAADEEYDLFVLTSNPIHRKRRRQNPRAGRAPRSSSEFRLCMALCFTKVTGLHPPSSLSRSRLSGKSNEIEVGNADRNADRDEKRLRAHPCIDHAGRRCRGAVAVLGRGRL